MEIFLLLGLDPGPWNGTAMINGNSSPALHLLIYDYLAVHRLPRHNAEQSILGSQIYIPIRNTVGAQMPEEIAGLCQVFRARYMTSHEW